MKDNAWRMLKSYPFSSLQSKLLEFPYIVIYLCIIASQDVIRSMKKK
jgi:hypothetical protein